MLEACFELATPLIVASIIDNGVRKGNMQHVFSMSMVIVGFLVLCFFCTVLAQYMAAKAGAGFGTTLRNEVAKKLMKLSYAQQDALEAETLIIRLTADVNQAQTGVNKGIRLLLRSPFIMIVANIMAFTINPLLALIGLVAVLIAGTCIFCITKYLIPKYKNIQRKLDSLTLSVRENLSGTRVIRAFRRQKQEIADFADKSDEMRFALVNTNKISALISPATFFLVNISVALLIWCGGVSVGNGIITQGQLVALVSYMTQILTAIVSMAKLISVLTKAFASMSRIAELLDIRTEEEGEKVLPDETRAGLSLNSVCFRYEGGSEDAVSDISLELAPGKKVGIIGGTGSGKTTLINLIMGLYKPTSGSITVGGAEISRAFMRDYAAIVPQKAVLFMGSVRTNLLAYAPDALEKDLFDALTNAQCDFVLKSSEGLEKFVEKGGKNLSGGQRQRLCIARALAKPSKLLIMDDSSSALDYATELQLRKSLKEVCADKTLIIISQRIASLIDSDEIIVLNEGRVIGRGTHRQLLKTCPEYLEISEMQLPKEALA